MTGLAIASRQPLPTSLAFELDNREIDHGKCECACDANRERTDM